MHEPVKGNLEAYLQGGSLPPVEEHLKQCLSCREKVAAMKAQQPLLRAVKTSDNIDPRPGFYSRVITRIESQARPSVWSLFGESPFAKHLAYASFSFVVLFGSYFVSSTMPRDLSQTAPEAIMASADSEVVVGDNPERDRETLLVTLATYEE
ncbi:MAG: hypothetical protein HYZ57_00900 [Acidobacteria bacterium]|nr:hypothetical protein [Acidobacteriota bacterium]MBI3278380.1 hypothetical protein [Acidobacteriota bacterium]